MRVPLIIPVSNIEHIARTTAEIAVLPFMNRLGGTLIYSASTFLLVVLASLSSSADWGVFRYIVSVTLTFTAALTACNALLGWLMFENASIAAFWGAVAAFVFDRPLVALGWMGNSTLSTITAWILIWIGVYSLLAVISEFKKALVPTKVLVALALLPGILTFAVLSSRITFSVFGWTEPAQATCSGDPWLLCYGVPQEQLPKWMRPFVGGAG